MWLCVGLSCFVIIAYFLLYNRIFAITFDENFAKATGVKVELYNLITSVIIAVIIVLAMNLVGSLLISALIIFPALSAMRVFKNYKAVVICSAITSVASALIGILTSVVYGTPVGSTIVAVDIAVFFGFCIVGKICGRRTK